MKLICHNKVWLFTLLIGLGQASIALAQQQTTQTISWSQSNQTGMTGWSGPTYLCVAGNRTLYNSNAPLTLDWTDTTGATVGAVRVDLSINWQYLYNPLPVFNVAINGVQQPGTLAPNGTQSNCTANTLTQTSYETGITTWNSTGANSLTITPTTITYASLNLAQTFMVQLVITQLNLPPNAASALSQVGPDSQGIGIGGTCFGTSMTLRAAVTDPDDDQVFLEAEFQPTSVFFTGTPTHTGTPVNSGTTATVDVTNLAAGGYHWRVRTVDPLGFRSAWVSFGNNSEIVADVVVDPNVVAIQTGTADEDKENGDCDMSVGAGPGTLIPSFLAAAFMAFGLARRRR